MRVTTIRPSFFIGERICATLGANAVPSIAPVTLGAGWNAAAGAPDALSDAGAADAEGAAAGAGASDAAGAGELAGASLESLCSREDVSVDGVWGDGADPPQARKTTEAVTTRARMRGSFDGGREPTSRRPPATNPKTPP